MKAFARSIKELLFRLKLYFMGVRFYEAAKEISSPPLHEATLFINGHIPVKFTVYQVECFDLVLRKGQVVADNYLSYVIQAVFQGHDEKEKYEEIDGRYFFFNGHFNRFGLTDEDVHTLIIDIYLDVIKGYISE